MKYVVIDVREPEEYSRSHVEGAINIPLASLTLDTKQLDDVKKDEHIIVYCLSGGRSNVAKQMLQSMGYSNVENGINQKQVAAKYSL